MLFMFCFLALAGACRTHTAYKGTNKKRNSVFFIVIFLKKWFWPARSALYMSIKDGCEKNIAIGVLILYFF